MNIGDDERRYIWWAGELTADPDGATVVLEIDETQHAMTWQAAAVQSGGEWRRLARSVEAFTGTSVVPGVGDVALTAGRHVGQPILSLTDGQIIEGDLFPIDVVGAPAAAAPLPPSEAAVLAAALGVLDAEVDVLTIQVGVLSTEADAIAADVVALTTGAGVLTSGLAAEIARALAAESANASAVGAEAARATAAEVLLAPKASPTFTGTVAGVTKAHVGLGNVDNTSDVNKPVSTAQAAADALKADAAATTAAIGALRDAAPVNLAVYGVLPAASAAANTAGLAAAAASGLTNFFLPAGAYPVTVPLGGAIMTFTGATRVRVRGDNATLNDTTTHSNNGALSSVFVFDNCKDVEVSGVDYVGQALASPSVLLGYQGAVFVRAINGTDGVKVDARVSHLRYAVQSGEYGDASKGNCRNFDLRIRGTKIGYPLAAYLADGIRHDIDVDGVHRAVYIAGCNDVTGVVRWRNQYIADTAYLITDCLTSGTDIAAQAAPPANATTSRGCTNIDVTSIDTGSAVFAPSSRCAGIALSRVDPCEFRNIKVRVDSVGTDTVSTTVGALMIASAAKTVWTRYPFNWESHVVLDGIQISGVVDHSTATAAGNTGSEFYVMAYDGGHAPTVRNFMVDGLTILPSSAAAPRSSYFFATGLTTPATFRNFHTPGLGLVLCTNATVTTVLAGTEVADLDVGGVTGGSRVSVGHGTKITSQTCNVPILNTTTYDGSIGGSGAVIRQKQITLTLAGATTTWAGAIPTGSIVMACQGRVQTVITGATGYTVGPPAEAARFVNTNTLTAGSTFGPANQVTTETAPRWYYATTDIVVTAKTSNFTGGTMRLVLSYITFGTPTA